ncbi:hypothetical protein LCGC14_0410360 [marine sediment metagenome]|uniref:Capsid assembly protein n=1 Tax=marine sediment metagenome TaxID=412755 RepID=A0A0F9TC70_9ZZZZ
MATQIQVVEEDTTVVEDTDNPPVTDALQEPVDQAPADPVEAKDSTADPVAPEPTVVDAAPDADTEKTADTKEEEPKEADEPWELDDDTIEAIADSYGDKLASTKGIKDIVAKSVKDEVARQVREYQSATDGQGQAEQLVNQGRVAAEKMQQFATKAAGELAKAANGEEGIDANVFDKTEFIGSLEQYGSATALYERHIFESATQDGFDHVFADVLPELSDEHREELQGIVNTANRMRGDPRQSQRADAYWMRELLGFVANRATENGRTLEHQQLTNRRAVKGKIADSNAVTAAKAKIEASKQPPRVPKSDPKAGPVEFSEEGYQRIKQSGVPSSEIQEYVNNWSAARRRSASIK